VFAGQARPITVVWRNISDKTVDTEIRARLYQTTSATAIPLSEKLWKKIEILPGQTVLESAQVDFPEVRAGTVFLIQWLEDTNRVIGKTEVLVYPTNLLKELKPLLGEDIPAVLDPNDELKPLLEANWLSLGHSNQKPKCAKVWRNPSRELPERAQPWSGFNRQRKRRTKSNRRFTSSPKARERWSSSNLTWLPVCRRIPSRNST
jgi:hypothetical protein